jgi:hypothetical protein
VVQDGAVRLSEGNTRRIEALFQDLETTLMLIKLTAIFANNPSISNDAPNRVLASYNRGD